MPTLSQQAKAKSKYTKPTLISEFLTFNCYSKKITSFNYNIKAYDNNTVIEYTQVSRKVYLHRVPIHDPHFLVWPYTLFQSGSKGN